MFLVFSPQLWWCSRFCVLVNLAFTITCAEPETVTAASSRRLDSIQTALSGQHLRSPKAAVERLSAMGLDTVRDLQMLRPVDWDELTYELKVAGLILGDRARIRQLQDRESASIQRQSARATQAAAGCCVRHQDQPSQRSVHNRRVQSDTTTNVSDGLPLDTLAILVTATLGLASYVLQAKLARDAEKSDREHDFRIAERDKMTTQAQVLLARVRSQMLDVYRPMTVALQAARTGHFYMAHELGFECLTKQILLEFVRPFKLWPDVEVFTREHSPEFFAAWRDTPYCKYSQRDIQVCSNLLCCRITYYVLSLKHNFHHADFGGSSHA
jgi:hypothetical protein